MNIQAMAKQANFTHTSDALDFLVNQAAKDNVSDEDAVREMAAYLRVKSALKVLEEENATLQQQLAAAREALQAAAALIVKFRDASEHWNGIWLGNDREEGCKDIAITYADCADDLEATLQRDRKPNHHRDKAMTDHNNQQAAREWLPIESAPKDESGPAVLIYNQDLALDDEFPGHPMIVSNAAYVACGNAAKEGYTHWCAIPSPPRPTQERK